MISYLTTLFNYDDWANRESLASLRRAEVPPERAVEVMAHIVGCQWLWIGRLRHAKESAVVWPQLTLDQCAAQLGELATEWKNYLGELTATSLAERVAYTNSKGEDWRSDVQDVLFHVVIHSGYHRGQIATLLGRAGQEPAYTDFIHRIRQQMIDTDDATKQSR